MPSSIKDKDTDSIARSAASTVTRATPPAAGQVSDAARGGAICVEIPLEVHGTQKPSEPGKPGEPFHEETTSVIVFPHGGVLRLSATVVPGQMIAVTNQNTERGMLCRIVNVRSYPNLKGYVEVEFTQSGTGFWAVDFMAENQSAPEIVSPSRAAVPAAPAVSIAIPPVITIPVPVTPVPVTPVPVMPSVVEAAPPEQELAEALPAVEVAEAERVELNVTGSVEEPVGSDDPVISEALISPEILEAAVASIVDRGLDLDTISAAATVTTPSIPEAATVPAPQDIFEIPSLPEEEMTDSAGASVSGVSISEGRAEADRAQAAKADATRLEFAAPESIVAEETEAELPAAIDIPAELAPMMSATHTISLPKAREAEDDSVSDDDASLIWNIDEEAAAPTRRAGTVPAPSSAATSYANSRTEQSAPPAAASADTLKELERLAMAHVGESVTGPGTVQPAAPSHSGAAKPGSDEAEERQRRSVNPPRRSSPLRSFTAEATSSPATTAPAGVTDASTSDSDFGGFLRDPEPRTASPRVFTGDTDRLGGFTGEDRAAPAPLRPTRSSTSIGVALATGVALIAIVACWFILGTKSTVRSLQPSNVPAVSSGESSAPGEPSATAPIPESLSPKASGSAASSNTRSAEQPDGGDFSSRDNGTTPSSSSSSRTPESSEPAHRSPMPWVVLTAPNPRPAASSAAPSGAEPPPSVTASAPGANSEGLNGIVNNGSGAVPSPVAPEGSPNNPVSVGGQVKEPRLLSSVIPAYPASAKQFNVQGDVQIRTTIDEFGRVKQMKVISGPSLLQRAAMDALRQWKYEPTKLDGKPVPVEIVVTVKFRRQ